ncbi:hypothetical protein PVAND_005755 [Polypedilum vanderplanki]|uniref:Serine-threonine/tyrosine-protein kinase catalytic domain-containing protein n=1 Tax=Polypedilum vanderplanki TaxID=319348 RepID=A0A9J6C1H0_POLVA|nr:hypothetical protein PVAND_005755 [Polypedilum vanderplanki]
MLNCWNAKPESRPLFNELERKLSSFMMDSVKDHYLDLNEPYMQSKYKKLLSMSPKSGVVKYNLRPDSPTIAKNLDTSPKNKKNVNKKPELPEEIPMLVTIKMACQFMTQMKSK